MVIEIMLEKRVSCWTAVTGFPGFALYLTAIAGAADPSIGAMA